MPSLPRPPCNPALARVDGLRVLPALADRLEDAALDDECDDTHHRPRGSRARSGAATGRFRCGGGCSTLIRRSPVSRARSPFVAGVPTSVASPGCVPGIASTGISPATVVPRPGSLRTSRDPSSAPSRSAIPCSPVPYPVRDGSKPLPSSRTSKRRRPSFRGEPDLRVRGVRVLRDVLERLEDREVHGRFPLPAGSDPRPPA
jgi:hypothetical protein